MHPDDYANWAKDPDPRKFASVNTCHMGVDLVVYDPNVNDEDGKLVGIQKMLSLNWQEVVELVEGHEKTSQVDPEMTDAALKMWGGEPTDA